MSELRPSWPLQPRPARLPFPQNILPLFQYTFPATNYPPLQPIVLDVAYNLLTLCSWLEPHASWRRAETRASRSRGGRGKEGFEDLNTYGGVDYY
jgi:hypothetical protein